MIIIAILKIKTKVNKTVSLLNGDLFFNLIPNRTDKGVVNWIFDLASIVFEYSVTIA